MVNVHVARGRCIRDYLYDVQSRTGEAGMRVGVIPFEIMLVVARSSGSQSFPVAIVACW
jgi:hypothetical protein